MTATQINHTKFNEPSIISNSINETMTKAMRVERNWKVMTMVSIILSVLLVSMLAAFLFYQYLITDSNLCALKIISRIDWTAQPPEEPPIPLNLPVARLVIAHTNTSMCYTQAKCRLIVRSIQADHVETQKMDDIAYNFLIGGDGIVYQGRGWNAEGRHTAAYNANSICIAIIGTFDIVKPTDQTLDAMHRLICEGKRLKKIANNYRLYGQCQLMNTTSPGQQVYETIQTWKHWTAEIQ